jgi:ribosomal protein S18 acetylase RimI-like enzyme
LLSLKNLPGGEFASGKAASHKASSEKVLSGKVLSEKAPSEKVQSEKDRPAKDRTADHAGSEHPVSIRLATVDDIGTVQNLARVIWAHTYEGVISEEDQARVLNQSYSRESLTKSIKEDVFLLAEVSVSPAGYVDMGIQNEVLYLHRLYVSPQFQRYGIGRRLLEAAIAECCRRFESIDLQARLRRGGVSATPKVVVATVERDNPKARSFYRKMGFTEESLTSVDMGGVELPVIYIVKQL